MSKHSRHPASHSSAGAQSGIALVEFTIVVPLLLLMLLGFTELGRALMQYTELTKTTRDAARYLSSASLGDGDSKLTDALITKGKDLVVYGQELPGTEPLLPGLSTEDVVVDDTFDAGTHVRVQVSYSYQPMIGAFLPSFGFGPDIDLGFTLVSTSDMRVL